MIHQAILQILSFWHFLKKNSFIYIYICIYRYIFFLHFWPCHMVSSILGSSTRDLKPKLLIVRGWTPNHWTREEVPWLSSYSSRVTLTLPCPKYQFCHYQNLDSVGLSFLISTREGWTTSSRWLPMPVLYDN